MFAILRHEKHHTIGTIGAASSHTMRTRSTPNADPGKPGPEVWIGSERPVDDVVQALPEKRRKNAVLALEYLVTASPEFFKDKPELEWRKYLRDQVEMLQHLYGEKNVVSVVLHQDETSPHLAVMVVPLIDGKLNARAFVGGREACSMIQDMAGEVGKRHGLERGKPRSRAKHQEVREWYQELAPNVQIARKTISDAEAQKTALVESAGVLVEHKAKLMKHALANQARELELLERLRQVEAREKTAEQLIASMTPEQVEKAAERFERLKAGDTPPKPPEEPQERPDDQGKGAGALPRPRGPR